jgi:hypothetical protein
MKRTIQNKPDSTILPIRLEKKGIRILTGKIRSLKTIKAKVINN